MKYDVYKVTIDGITRLVRIKKGKEIMDYITDHFEAPRRTFKIEKANIAFYSGICL